MSDFWLPYGSCVDCLDAYRDLGLDALISIPDDHRCGVDTFDDRCQMCAKLKCLTPAECARKLNA